MQRKTPFVEGEFYHLYNRGVDKREIFSSDADYKRFTALMYLANSEKDVRMGNFPKQMTYKNIFSIERGKPLVALEAFCLMPNHFHLLLTPLSEKGVSRFMLKLQTGYSMYFNIRNERNGSLFQGPFKSEHVTDDTYLKYLFSYIHLNPLKLRDPHWKEKIDEQSAYAKFVKEYPYSSLGSYIHDEHVITNPNLFPPYLSSPKDIENHITDWFKQG